jgi:tetratricopeptide (TPR) repeat protein
VSVSPDDAAAWRDLGTASLELGDLAGAAEAFRRAIRLRPEDTATTVDLAHVAYLLGAVDEAIELLTSVAETDETGVTQTVPALRSLVDMYRRAGRLPEALRSAEEIARRQPDDVLAALDIADLNRALGNLDEAAAAYARLRRLDTEPEHEVYVLHGMIGVEMQREQWRRALDLAIETTTIDRFSLTTDLLSFAVTQLFGRSPDAPSSGRPALTRDEINAALAAERAEHRRLHAESLYLRSGTGAPVSGVH